jgi:hypothetical protein
VLMLGLLGVGVCVRATVSSPSIWSQICLVVGGFCCVAWIDPPYI